VTILGQMDPEQDIIDPGGMTIGWINLITIKVVFKISSCLYTNVQGNLSMEISPFKSDENVRSAILAEFSVDERIAHAHVRVGVLNGIAHLVGEVDTLVERTAAEDIARQVKGVRGVVNRIAAPGAPSPAREINLDIKNTD